MRTTAAAKYLNSPNDIVARSDGSIYFTDPDYGRWNDWIGIKREPELGFKAVLRIASDGTTGEARPVVAADEFDQPNGLCFSPDESLLYVNDSPRAHIKVFEVEPDGSLSRGRVFHEGIGGGFKEDDDLDQEAAHRELHDAGAVDGMKCDELGNVWVTGPGGVWIISPEGVHLGVLRAPEVVGNLTWGGADLRSLFLMTSTTVHVVSTYELGTGYGHIAIGVEDLTGTLARLAEQGIEPEREPYQVREGGSWLCFVRDPDGYRIEIIGSS